MYMGVYGYVKVECKPKHCSSQAIAIHTVSTVSGVVVKQHLMLSQSCSLAEACNTFLFFCRGAGVCGGG